jgi:hypothetical protein
MSDDHTIGETRTTAERRLTDGDATVTVRKLVSKGERLAIDSGDASVRLDALLLEGLSWQRDRAAVDDLLGSDTAVATDPAATADGEETAGTVVTADTDGAISVSSEYAHVFVRDVTTPAGDALVITTPGRGTSITLGVQSLRVLAGVADTSVFSVWFRTPFGPEDTAVEGPL